MTKLEIASLKYGGNFDFSHKILNFCLLPQFLDNVWKERKTLSFMYNVDVSIRGHLSARVTFAICLMKSCHLNLIIQCK